MYLVVPKKRITFVGNLKINTMKKLISTIAIVLAFSSCSNEEMCGEVMGIGTDRDGDRFIIIANERILVTDYVYNNVTIGDIECVTY